MEKELYKALALLVDRHDDQMLTSEEWALARAALDRYDAAQLRNALRTAWTLGANHERPSFDILNDWRDILTR